ncbi:hypothetical protein E2562_012787 [Oryza meyeriana var. granulata]|uniref:Uncharacterized protein n=1 Tax=Oryza meyeriana var. granulata TaxID=110450 RepID=A0A6G1DHS7_9ORYZ|nr:hypothetical protein E2562_012787 [Oryza meyeriana var. granulata]
MCDCYTPQIEPIPTNKRYNAAKIFSHPDVAAEIPVGVISSKRSKCISLLLETIILPAATPSSGLDSAAAQGPPPHRAARPHTPTGGSLPSGRDASAPPLGGLAFGSIAS